MNSETISLVQESFKQVLPIKDQAADMFYDRLFALDPDLRKLFKPDMSEQKQALMTILATAVNNLNNLGEILPAVQKLGQSHVDYGVKPEHYTTVGTALIDTLKAAFGDQWTPKLETAWTDVYGVLASTMIEAGAARSAA